MITNGGPFDANLRLSLTPLVIAWKRLLTMSGEDFLNLTAVQPKLP